MPISLIILWSSKKIMHTLWQSHMACWKIWHLDRWFSQHIYMIFPPMYVYTYIHIIYVYIYVCKYIYIYILYIFIYLFVYMYIIIWTAIPSGFSHDFPMFPLKPPAFSERHQHLATVHRHSVERGFLEVQGHATCVGPGIGIGWNRPVDLS